jgi:hypothetical protein
MRIISAKKEALQALSISKNGVWDALTLPFEEIEKFINCTRDTPMNHRIRPCQLGVALGDRPKSSKLLHGIFLLVARDAFAKGAEILTRPSPDYGRAIAQFQRAIKQFSSYYEAYTEMSIAQFRLGDSQGAE